MQFPILKYCQYFSLKTEENQEKPYSGVPETRSRFQSRTLRIQVLDR